MLQSGYIMAGNTLPFVEQIYKNPLKRMKGVVFLDRDDTLIRDTNYLRSIDQVEIFPGVIEGLQLLQAHDFLLVVITNQAAVAKGFITIPQLQEINDYIVSLFAKKNITIHAVYSCPHHPNADLIEYRQICLCRKPSTAMLERAIQMFSADVTNTYMVGDRPGDIAAGKSLGAKTYLLQTNTAQNQIDSQPDFHYTNFLDIARHIVK